MKWFVYRENRSTNEIELFNVFNHYDFRQDVEKNFKKYKDDIKEFSTKVRNSALYYFAWKCEYEVYVTSMFKDKPLKIDIYQQLDMNWDSFIDYIYKSLI